MKDFKSFANDTNFNMHVNVNSYTYNAKCNKSKYYIRIHVEI